MCDRFSPWLRQLSLVTSGELVYALGLPLLTVLAALVTGLLESWQVSLIFGASHLLLWLAAVCSVPRIWSLLILLLIAISLVNYCVYVWLQYPGVVLIAYVYAVIALCISLAALVAWYRIRNAWSQLRHAQSKEDLRWLVTLAPLYFRWQIARQLAKSGVRG